MQPYREYRPTGFDAAGLNLNDRQGWFVLGLSITRDSGPHDLSNWHTAIDELGGESDDVEIHNFGHWACGWFDIILIRPGSKAESIGYDIERSLEDYPLLDEDDASDREYAEYYESWELWACHDFRRMITRKLDGHPRCESLIDNVSSNDLMTFFESLNPCGDFYHVEGSGVSINFPDPTVSEIVEFILECRSAMAKKENV